MKRSALVARLFLLLVLLSMSVKAEKDRPGYLGVYVTQVRGGMQITRFIPGTPAALLEAIGEMNRGDVIIKLAGKDTATLEQLREARALIPAGQEAKMVLRNRRGDAYHVWVSPTSPVVSSSPITSDSGLSVLPGTPVDRYAPDTKPLVEGPQQPLPGSLPISGLARDQTLTTGEYRPSVPGANRSQNSSNAPGGVKNRLSDNATSGRPQSQRTDQSNPTRAINPSQPAALPAGEPDQLSKGGSGDGGASNFRELPMPRKPAD